MAAGHRKMFQDGGTVPNTGAPLPRLQGALYRTGQTPTQARRRIVKLDRTAQAAFRQLFHDCRAEPAPLRRRHRRPLTLGPTHAKVVAAGGPADVHTTSISRERPVFAGVGGEFVQGEPDGLRRICSEAQFGATNVDTRTNEVGEIRELTANQVIDVNSPPLVPDEQVLVGGKRLDAFGEAVDEIFRTLGSGLACDRSDKAQNILGAMIDLT